MPVIFYVEANNAIWEYEVEASLPSAYIVAMKANVMKEDRIKYREAGLNVFLWKPFTL